MFSTLQSRRHLKRSSMSDLELSLQQPLKSFIFADLHHWIFRSHTADECFLLQFRPCRRLSFTLIDYANRSKHWLWSDTNPILCNNHNFTANEHEKTALDNSITLQVFSLAMILWPLMQNRSHLWLWKINTIKENCNSPGILKQFTSSANISVKLINSTEVNSNVKD